MEGVSSHGESETLHTPTVQNMETRPKSTLKILYYNARSLLPKFDELLLSADTHCPDVICITESWLCNDIQDTEIAIPGYQLVRLDRNRHGGDVLMYVLHKFIVKLFPTHPSLELLTNVIITNIVYHCSIALLAHLLMYCLLSIVTWSQLTFLSFLVLYSSEILT